MYEPAGNFRVVGCGARSADALAPVSWDWSLGPPARSPERLALLASPSAPLLVSVGVGRGGGFFPGPVTVDSAVAREISTACFCSTRSSSACVPGRGSSAGSTYAAGPSVRAFRIDRLLLV